MMFWRKQPMLKGYVSEIDRFLTEFDRKPEASSVSRRSEEAKYEAITVLRDKADAKQPLFQIWEDE
jgi:hypothetical protein